MQDYNPLFAGHDKPAGRYNAYIWRTVVMIKKRTLLAFSSLFVFFLLASVLRAENPDRVIVYYFYTNYRCPTCLKLEQYTKEAVEQYYSDEIKAGTVEFKALNTDEEANKHFMKDYQLYTKSVVLSLVKDGKEQKYENLPEIWDHVRNKETFFRYIKDETDTYIAEVKL